MLTEDKTQVSLRVSAKTVAQFDRIAELLERDRTWVMVRALALYLEEEGADLVEEAAGIAELNQGAGVGLDEALNEARALISDIEARRTARTD